MISARMLEMAAKAEARYGDAYAILLRPNVGNSASPIYRYVDGQEEQTQWQQATSDMAEEQEMKDMIGLVIISSFWDEDKQRYVCIQEVRKNDESEDSDGETT